MTRHKLGDSTDEYQATTAQPDLPATLNPLTDISANDRLGHYVEMWKKSVDVQQHFNDIEWRIRGLALTVATFAFGAAGIAAKDGTKIGPLSLGSLVVFLGLLLWYGFYFVDRVWYHPLLKSAVDRGTAIENEIKKSLPQAGMTGGITAGSPQQVGKIVAFLNTPFRRVRVLHSDDKLVWFYKVGAFAFAIAGLALQVGASLSTDTVDRQQIDVRIESPTPVPPPVASGASATPSPAVTKLPEPSPSRSRAR